MAALTIKKTGAPENQTMKVLLAGSPGSGKTRLSSTFPSPLYASAEGGLLSIADRNIPFIEIQSIDQLHLLKIMLDQDVQARQEHFGFPIETLVVDTIDEVQRIMIRERLTETRKEALQLQDYGYLKEAMTAMIRGFRNISNLNVIFTVHLSDKTDSVTGKMFVRPGLQGAIGDEIAQYVDLALLIKTSQKTEVTEGQARKVLVRTLQTAPDDLHDWVKDRSGQLPAEIPVDFEGDYDRLYKLVFGHIADLPESSEILVGDDSPTVAAPVVADPKAVASMQRGEKRQSLKEQVPIEPQIGFQPEQVSTVTEPEPETVPEVETPVLEPAEPEVDLTKELEEARNTEAPFGLCTECGEPIETEDFHDMSMIKYRVALCKAHFQARKKR